MTSVSRVKLLFERLDLRLECLDVLNLLAKAAPRRSYGSVGAEKSLVDVDVVTRRLRA